MKYKSPQKLKSDLIKKLDALMFKILILERGARCQICGGRAGLGTFHILEKGKYQRIRYDKKNLLIAGWFCCHNAWHHTFEAKERIDKRIKEIVGENYRNELKAQNYTSIKLTLVYLNMLHAVFKAELKQLEGK